MPKLVVRQTMIFIGTHLGLGDLILQNGLCRVLAEKEPVHLACQQKYLESVRFMFHDNPNIQPVVVHDSPEAMREFSKRYDHPVLLGRVHPDGKAFLGDMNFDESFYFRAGVPFEAKWARFRVDLKQLGWTIPRGRYVFLHEDPTRNLLIDRRKVRNDLPIFQPSGHSNFFDYVPLMLGAEEIHCIVSCFMCYVDTARLPNKKVAHLYSRTWDGGDNRYDLTRFPDWEIVQ
jgi:hypothetical protein